jgi:hypothetical protein
VSWLLPDWDGSGANRVLPRWAAELAGTCEAYAFTTMQVHEGRAVVAVKTGDGSGPLLVITRDEDEMLTALGLKPRMPCE